MWNSTVPGQTAKPNGVFFGLSTLAEKYFNPKRRGQPISSLPNRMREVYAAPDRRRELAAHHARNAASEIERISATVHDFARAAGINALELRPVKAGRALHPLIEAYGRDIHARLAPAITAHDMMHDTNLREAYMASLEEWMAAAEAIAKSQPHRPGCKLDRNLAWAGVLSNILKKLQAIVAEISRLNTSR